MVKKRDQRKGQTRRARRASASTGQWVGLALVAGLILGGTVGYYVGTAVTQAEAGITDAYGRSPDHPHYNHDHR